MIDKTGPNRVVEQCVLLYYHRGPLTDPDERDREIAAWFASLTPEDATGMIRWAERHQYEPGYFQVSAEWEVSTVRSLFECIGHVLLATGDEPLRLQVERCLENVALRAPALQSLAIARSRASVPAVKRVIRDDRPAVVEDLGFFLSSVNSDESIVILCELINYYNASPTVHSMLKGWLIEALGSEQLR